MTKTFIQDLVNDMTLDEKLGPINPARSSLLGFGRYRGFNRTI